MKDITDSIVQHCEIYGNTQADLDMVGLPKQYYHFLSRVNGFVTSKGFFRFFGTAQLDGLPSLQEWNNSGWKSEYGYLFDDIFVIAEDVFGDQYGFDIAERESPRLCKVNCEGGAKQYFKQQNLYKFIKNQVFDDLDKSFDYSLAMDAYNSGIATEIHEHLSFQLPLICGGEYALSNLGVESVSLHLGLLAQLSRKNNLINDEIKIDKFVEE